MAAPSSNATGNHRHLIAFGSPLYPECLLDLPSPPLVLYAHGNVDLLRLRGIAMVGSRNASRTGLETARAFARELSLAGWVVVSGLAEGIDTAAHEGALAGTGATIAVLGNGLNQVYPKHNRKLARNILESSGLLLSEYPPKPNHCLCFSPRRNRIIAAQSRGTLVVEAALRSGSLITSRIASQLGRVAMAIPGSIHSPHSKGCHHMIKNGALLVETVREITTELEATTSEAWLPASMLQTCTVQEPVAPVINSTRKAKGKSRPMAQKELKTPHSVNAPGNLSAELAAYSTPWATNPAMRMKLPNQAHWLWMTYWAYSPNLSWKAWFCANPATDGLKHHLLPSKPYGLRVYVELALGSIQNF
ncbi:MAG: DNA-protecting protein DprA [Limnobacter sp.]|nr:DNA-protecting protein DprA [Limnobacter sp.]